MEYVTQQEAQNALKALSSTHLYGRHLVSELNYGFEKFYVMNLPHCPSSPLFLRCLEGAVKTSNI